MEQTTTLEPTGKGLIDFLNYASQRGLVNANTAGGLRAASKEVLTAVEPDGWQDVDLHTVDVDDFAIRFERLRASRFKPDSLLVYKSRFRNAVQMYLEYLKSPSQWKYKAERPAAARKKASVTPMAPEPAAEATPSASTRSSTIDFPFPLRPGMVVSLRLPVDLTKAESKRLAGFIESLATEPTLALPAASAFPTGNGGARPNPPE